MTLMEKNVASNLFSSLVISCIRCVSGLGDLWSDPSLVKQGNKAETLISFQRGKKRTTVMQRSSQICPIKSCSSLIKCLTIVLSFRHLLHFCHIKITNCSLLYWGFLCQTNIKSCIILQWNKKVEQKLMDATCFLCQQYKLTQCLKAT